MVASDIIVVGASAGGVEPLKQFVQALDTADVSVFVVLHLAPNSESVLPAILRRVSTLTCKHPVDDEAILPRHVYVAAPDRHLTVHEGRLRCVRGPRVNGCRPAVDPLFRSAAVAYGSRVIGVVLSGALDDGAEGLAAIKAHGGLAFVQDPEEALYPSMPEHALLGVTADHVASASELGSLARRKASLPRAVPYEVARADERAAEVSSAALVSVKEAAAFDASEVAGAMLSDDAKLVAMAEFEPAFMNDENRPGHPSSFSCPDCGGVLWERPHHPYHFACRIGHAYDAETLLHGQREGVDTALWQTLRTLKDSQMLLRRLVERAVARGHRHSAEQFRERLEDADRRVEVVRALLDPDSAKRAAEPTTAGGMRGRRGGKS